MTLADHRPRVAAERRERMKVRLLESALSIAATKGPERLSIDDVIAAAEVSRGTFYKYFDSPGSLIQELAVEVSNAVIQTMHPLVDPLDDVAQRMAAGVRMSLRLVRAHPILGAFMVRAGWPVAERTQLYFVVVGADIRKGIRQGRFARMHGDVALNLLAGSMVGAMHSITRGSVPRDFPEQTAAAVLRALGLPALEAAALSTQSLPTPVIEPGTLLSRLLHRHED
jgi:TetR/AcrR family transcriptional regulator, ethionamide resistance regulator